jgi:hypothetical protein
MSTRRFISGIYQEGFPENSNVLPVCLPVPLRKENLPEIWGSTSSQYVVSPEINGIRGLLGFYTDSQKKISFRMDRGMNESRLNLSISDEAFYGTLLDCIFTVSGDSVYIWILDSICINGHADVKDKPYTHRLEAAQMLLSMNKDNKKIKWNTEAKNAIYSMGNWIQCSENIYISVKPVWYHNDPQYAVEWGESVTNINGVVYIPQTRIISIGRSLNIYKWCPPGRRTVDFSIQPVSEDHTMMDLMCDNGKGGMILYARVPIRSDDPNLIIRPGFIFECRWDTSESTWFIKMARTDLNTPNVKKLIDGILECENEKIELKDLDPSSLTDVAL